MTTKPIIIVQGGQYGSEAKGLITQKLTLLRQADVAIRTSTVNAGHTIWHKGRQYKMQQLPVSWVRPECKLIIGPGAFISPEILQREIDWVNEAMPEADVRDRLFIDYRCGLHLPYHTHLAKEADRTSKMGATGKGCSEAVMAKIRDRGKGLTTLFTDWLAHVDYIKGLRIVDTVAIVNEEWDHGRQLIIEGTQGTFLDLHIGPWPYTTHKQTQAASWMAEAGLSCTLPTELWLVMRTYPIRVAGNSGPLPGEITWAELAYRTGQPEEMLTERTTVTNKVRRVAEWDWDTAKYSAMLNRPHKLAITFLNYKFPVRRLQMAEMNHWLGRVEDAMECPVGMLSWGPNVEDCAEVNR